MGCCDSFCRVSFIKYYNKYIKIMIQDKLEENLSHERFINDENEIISDALNNNILPDDQLLPPQINNENSNNNIPNINNKPDKILKNSSEYTFQNNFNNNLANNNFSNENNENGYNDIHQDVNDINNYLSNENNDLDNGNNNDNKDIINNKKEDVDNNNIVNEVPSVKQKKNKIMDRIKKGRKKEQNKNEEGENKYKKSEKIQNFANELEKVMFSPK